MHTRSGIRTKAPQGYAPPPRSAPSTAAPTSARSSSGEAYPGRAASPCGKAPPQAVPRLPEGTPPRAGTAHRRQPRPGAHLPYRPRDAGATRCRVIGAPSIRTEGAAPRSGVIVKRTGSGAAHVQIEQPDAEPKRAQPHQKQGPRRVQGGAGQPPSPHPPHPPEDPTQHPGGPEGRSPVPPWRHCTGNIQSVQRAAGQRRIS